MTHLRSHSQRAEDLESEPRSDRLQTPPSCVFVKYCYIYDVPCGFAYNAGDPGLNPGSGISLGDENGNLLQYPCLENPMDGGSWLATVHGVAKSQTRLSNFTFMYKYTHVYILFQIVFHYG